LIRPSTSGTGDGWTLKSSEYGSDPTLRPTLEIVYSVPTPASPYAIWAAARGLTGVNNSPGADPDDDGADNLAEFAYNLNPLVVDSVALTPTGTSGLPAALYSDGGLGVQFIRRKGPSSVGLSYAVQFSSDFSDWSPGLAPSVTPVAEDWERVTVRDASVGPSASRFARIKLTLQQ
jgi:hypothetical protein